MFFFFYWRWCCTCIYIYITLSSIKGVIKSNSLFRVILFLLPGCVTSRHDLVKGHCDMSVGLVPVYFINTWSHAVSITYGTF